MYRTRNFSSTDMLPRHHQQYVRILVQQDRDTSSVNATSSIRLYKQCREQYREQYREHYREQYRTRE